MTERLEAMCGSEHLYPAGSGMTGAADSGIGGEAEEVPEENRL